MDFQNMKAVADSHVAEITRDVLTRRAADFTGSSRPDIAALMAEYGALFEQLLQEAAGLGFLAGCQYGAEVSAGIHEAPSAAVN